ncbi:MAG: hypothetical protein LW688_07365 [Cryomorphaceae bacterium]|jgi:ComF family protein|nr:hypothetical protein [Cryomorphaceae bacterium]
MSLPASKSTLFNLNFWSNIRKDTFHLLYPSTCLICDCEWKEKLPLCSWCSEEFKYTNFENYQEATPLDKLFWGRLELNATYALLHFEKNTSTQGLLHAIKYGNRPSLARYLGELVGQRLVQIEKFSNIDALIPVPLHPKKQFVRGYNQSEQISIGIANILKVSVESTYVRKATHVSSQTGMGRFQRWANVEGNFLVKKGLRETIHLAIVDDVVTTGSTLEAMVRAIKKEYPKATISIVSLAFAT